MRSFFIFLIVLFLKFSIATSQTLQWAKQFGGSGFDLINKITIDQNGNIYGTGSSDSINNDVTICKLDSNGVLIWSRFIGNIGVDFGVKIKIENDTNLFITGYFEDTVDFDPGNLVFNLHTTGIRDAFILKLDSSGNFLWVNKLGSKFDDQGFDCATDINGNIYFCGTFSDTVYVNTTQGTDTIISCGSNDIFISKLDGNGNFLWVKEIGGTSNDNVFSIITDSNNDLIFCGTFSDTCDFNSDPILNYDLISSGDQDGFVCKIDFNGGFTWVKQITGSQFNANLDICADSNGNLFV